MMALNQPTSMIAKLRALSLRDALDLAEAMVLVTVAAPIVRFLPLARIGRIAAVRVRGASPAAAPRAALIERIAWSIARTAKRSPLRALCFERGLAAQIMLRRRGVDSTLFYGATMRDGTSLDAHVWVTADGVDVTGGSLARDYAVLATFPDGRAGKPLPTPRPLS